MPKKPAKPADPTPPPEDEGDDAFGLDEPDPGDPPPREPDPEAAPPPARKHPARLTTLAKHYGYSDEELAELDTPTLTAELQLIQNERLAAAREVPRHPPQRQQPVAPPPEEEYDYGEYEEDGQKKRVDINRFDAETKAVLRTLARQNHELRKRADAGELERFRDTLDSLFAQHEATYGKGNRYTHEGTGTRFEQRREAVYNQVMALLRSGRNGKRLGDDFAAIHANLFGDDAPPAAKKAAAESDLPDDYLDESPPPRPAPRPRPSRAAAPAGDDDPDEAAARKREEAWVRGGLAPPTQRKAKELPYGVDRAARAFARRRQEAKANGRHDPEDTLPDFDEV